MDPKKKAKVKGPMVPQKPKGLLYTGERLQRTRQVTRSTQETNGLAEFKVERRRGRPSRPLAPEAPEPEHDVWPVGLVFEPVDDGWEDEQAERGDDCPDFIE